MFCNLVDTVVQLRDLSMLEQRGPHTLFCGSYLYILFVILYLGRGRAVKKCTTFYFVVFLVLLVCN